MGKPLKGINYSTFISGEKDDEFIGYEPVTIPKEWHSELLQSLREATAITNELERLRKVDSNLLREPMTI